MIQDEIEMKKYSIERNGNGKRMVGGEIMMRKNDRKQNGAK